MKIRLLLILLITSFSIYYSTAECLLTAPNISNNGSPTACQVTIKWKGNVNTAYYKLRYKVQGSSSWIATINVGLLNKYTISGLNSGTKYVFQVIPYCSNNQPGPVAQKTAMTTFCSRPMDVDTSNITSNSATISWTQCGTSAGSYVRYRKMGTVVWKMVSVGSNSSVVLSPLDSSTTYQYQINGCDTANLSLWTPASTFTTLGPVATKPNILIILLDDCRYDVFQENGGPLWFSTPAISRIANEGANFKFTFPATSLCSPSRASIMSGLYPHHHGVFGGDTTLSTFSPTTLAEILHDNGYYTGFVGKYGYQKFPIPGYDYYCESSSDLYFNSTYDINGQFGVTIPGHKTEIFTYKALDFLSQVPPGKPFCLFLYHKAPHFPYDCRPADAHLFTNNQMPIPQNTVAYTENYPSYLYNCDVMNSTGTSLGNNIRAYYRMIAGAEWSVDTVLQYLDSHNLTDSTLIIFSSDNGLMKGEHKKSGKGIALEESIRLPMFIRYPKWINPGIIIDSAMAMNIDIAPTVLDFAGIPNTYNMDGVSMRALASKNAIRKQLFYEYFWYGRCMPTMIGIRDYRYKYIQSNCSQQTEEFYDLENDPYENVNEINSVNYAGVIAFYQNKLDSLAQLYGYVNLSPEILDCELANPVFTGKFSDEDDIPESDIAVYPNPGSNELIITIRKSSPAQIIVRDISSHIISKENLTDNNPTKEQAIDISPWPAGIYFIEVVTNDGNEIVQFVKQ